MIYQLKTKGKQKVNKSMIWVILALIFIMDFFEHRRRGRRIKALENKMDTIHLLIISEKQKDRYSKG